MNAIADHIKTTLTSDDENKTVRPLDVIAGTHQHNDHLSGFVHAKRVFEEIGAHHIWLSWLDNPTDKQAIAIGSGQRKLAKKLQAAYSGIAAVASLKRVQAARRVKDILGFYALDGKPAKDAPFVPQQGVENLKAIRKPLYLEPGTIMDLPGLEPGVVRVYVLGPPRENNNLFDISPGKRESYDAHLSAATSLAEGLLSALTNYTPGNPAQDEPFFPFDASYDLQDMGAPFLTASYGLPADKWRTIDDDWLEQAERLALYLDSYTNNSSLVLAFELIESGKVLLFVGDAQTGNWLSWKTIKWEMKKLGLDELLAKTVLYKVGHHGSHNATLPEYLEKMEHPDLVAMIPVDFTDPNITKKNGWKMPAANLYKKIIQMTGGKVLRMDCAYGENCGPDGPCAPARWGNLLDNVKTDTLFVEYSIKG
jgi:hypothetical protein